MCTTYALENPLDSLFRNAYSPESNSRSAADPRSHTSPCTTLLLHLLLLALILLLIVYILLLLISPHTRPTTTKTTVNSRTTSTWTASS
jgi:hypothetical protein